jgi:hypothetical protein
VTARKQSSSPIRTRCIRFIEILRHCGYDRQIPLDKAKEIFQKSLGFFDRTTIKAYFGTQAHINKRIVNVRGRYSTGTITDKTLELTQVISQKKGYLEILELATIQKKGSTWFLILKNESLVPEMGSCTEESVSESNREISLSSNTLLPQGEGSEGNRFEKVSLDIETTERSQTHTLQGEREKSGEKSNLSPFSLIFARRVEERNAGLTT